MAMVANLTRDTGTGVPHMAGLCPNMAGLVGHYDTYAIWPPPNARAWVKLFVYR